MGLKIRDIKRVEVETNAGNSVLAYTIATSSNTNIRVRTELIGKRLSNSDTFVDISEHCFKNVSGTVSQVGSSASIFKVHDTDVHHSSLSFNISGTNIEVYVNADPDTNVLEMSWELVIYIEVN